MDVEELRDVLDRWDEWRGALWQVMPNEVFEDLVVIVETVGSVANPNLKAMGKVNYALSHNDYSEAELQSLFVAALTPRDTE